MLLRFIKINEKHKLRLNFKQSDAYGQEDAEPSEQLTEAVPPGNHTGLRAGSWAPGLSSLHGPESYTALQNSEDNSIKTAASSSRMFP